MHTNAPDTTVGKQHSLEKHLLQLNEQYVRASLASNVEWFRAHLADEFVCIDSDGTVLARDAFLRMAAMDSDLREYKLDDVDVRFYVHVALVRASGSWVNKDGVHGASRYIDVYVYTDGAWKVVSAQITRPGRS